MEEMEPWDADENMDQPPQMVITIAEAQCLLLDWIEARDKWYAERKQSSLRRRVRAK